jgi:hypothetical protein
MWRMVRSNAHVEIDLGQARQVIFPTRRDARSLREIFLAVNRARQAMRRRTEDLKA